MIRQLHINNFKSLVDFSLPIAPHRLGQFVCLVGLNGAGKSTLLQVFDFLGQLIHGRMDDWLALRGWRKSDLTSRFLKRRLIDFSLEMYFENIGVIVWQGAYNADLLRCTQEKLTVDDKTVLHLVDGKVLMSDLRYAAFDFNYQGSVMSIFNYTEEIQALRAFKQFMLGLKSLDMLSPYLMRKRAREGHDVGIGGEKLSAFLHGYSATEKREFLEQLRDFYPQIRAWETRSTRSGWKDLFIDEMYPGALVERIEIDARHINDGMLRVISILAQTRTEQSVLLFDEIENGINPESIPKLVSHLIGAKQQILVTTHSPMILNYLPDAVAEEAVVLLYRTGDGSTRSIRFFDVPSTRKKLSLLGPGEVFVDTDLSDLAEEAESLRKAVS